jgi:membrane associated rhomboid family serine protease
MLLLPYHIDVPMRCRPWMNWVLIGVTVLFYPLCVSGGRFTDLGESLVLGRGSLGWLGHVLIHADLVHLLGNMLFLWVFGNAVCAKVGNLAYPFVYFGLGLAAGVVAQMIDSRPAVGASGAINGIVGMFVVWYLLNEISCWYAFWFFAPPVTGTFSVGSFWIIFLWLAFDIYGAVRGGGNVGYVAHLAGFAGGFGLAIVLLKSGLVEMDRGERSLLQALSGDEESED